MDVRCGGQWSHDRHARGAFRGDRDRDRNAWCSGRWWPNPALQSQEAVAKPFRTQTLRVAWISLAVAVISGLTWVLLLTMSLSGESLGEAVMSGALRDVLNLTQFGLVSQIRLVLAIVLAICLTFERSALWRWLALAAAWAWLHQSPGPDMPRQRRTNWGMSISPPMRCMSLRRQPGSAASCHWCFCSPLSAGSSLAGGCAGAGCGAPVFDTGHAQRGDPRAERHR